MSEVNVKLNETNGVVDKNSIMNAFKNEFSTSVIPIYVNSIGKSVNFSEVSVKQQKSISKTLIQNENRKDIVYDTQCQLINKLCLQDDFDIYRLTEFDRIRILMEIYSLNYIQNDIEFKCPECGTVNRYRIDFEKIIQRLNQFEITDKTYTIEDKVREYRFTVNYPTVYNVSEFYKEYVKKYRNVNQKEREMLDNLGNIEYVNLFIKKIEIVNKNGGTPITADLTTLSLEEQEQLFNYFPQNIIFDSNTGVLQYITTEFIEKINEAFQYEKCGQCGYQTKEGIGDLVDFF